MIIESVKKEADVTLVLILLRLAMWLIVYLMAIMTLLIYRVIVHYMHTKTDGYRCISYLTSLSTNITKVSR